MWKLSENRTRIRFKNRVKELINLYAPDLRKSFKDGVLIIKCVGRRSLGEIEETCGGGMKKLRIR